MIVDTISWVISSVETLRAFSVLRTLLSLAGVVPREDRLLAWCGVYCDTMHMLQVWRNSHIVLALMASSFWANLTHTELLSKDRTG